jgi:hypothetical protein
VKPNPRTSGGIVHRFDDSHHAILEITTFLTTTMERHYLPLLMLSASALVHAYPRSDLPSIKFAYKDWEIACDNTRTCRAAGYHAEDDAPNASILLTRLAGPDQPVRVELQLADDPDHPSVPSSLQMTIGGRAFGTVRIDGTNNKGTLSAAQTSALLPALLKDGELAWTGGGKRWTISPAGANAVLMKMDEFQGRIDTPGALVRKGGKAESSALPALPLPVVEAVSVPTGDKAAVQLDARQQHALLAALRKTIHDDDCDGLDQPDALEVRRLSRTSLLVSHQCWQAAYNTGDGYWVVNAQPPYSPVLVTTSATDYANGTIRTVQKGRGIGDCMALTAWTWDGMTFSQTQDETTGMCRQIAAGGAWRLPTLVTTVRQAK